jgi:TRAP-type mannitol/chloroaromatic compound transport system permease large subunit
MIGLIMFAITLILLMVGFPVAFTFAGVAVIFGVLTQGVDLFAFITINNIKVMANIIKPIIGLAPHSYIWQIICQK